MRFEGSLNVDLNEITMVRPTGGVKRGKDGDLEGGLYQWVGVGESG